MQATLTEIHRQAKKVFRPVQAGQAVRITEHGKPIARIVPEVETVTVSLAEFLATEFSDQAILDAIDESHE